MTEKLKRHAIQAAAAFFAVAIFVMLASVPHEEAGAPLPHAECGKSQETCDALVSDIRSLRDPEYGVVRAGLPRYGAPFGRDSLIIAWQLLNYDPKIAKDTLFFWAKRQGKKKSSFGEEPGKIPHWANPKRRKQTVYYSTDATPLYVFLAGEYLKKTGDATALRALWPNIVAALEWCEKYGDSNTDLFIDYRPIKDKDDGMFHQGWKDGNSDHLHLAPPVALVEIQGYYFAALKNGEYIARLLGYVVQAEGYAEHARELRRVFLRDFWIPDSHMFAFAIEGGGKKDTRVVSNIGQLLFTGILDDNPVERGAVVRRMFEPDMWTKYGIRTGATTNWDFESRAYHQGTIWPHDNWIIAQGLKRYAYSAEYNAVRSAQVRAFRALGGIPELYVVEKNGALKPWPEACMPQGWASAGLLDFLIKK